MPNHLTKRFFKSLFNFYAEASDKSYNLNAVASYKVLVMKYGKNCSNENFNSLKL
jgi:hypothetical protein